MNGDRHDDLLDGDLGPALARLRDDLTAPVGDDLVRRHVAAMVEAAADGTVVEIDRRRTALHHVTHLRRSSQFAGAGLVAAVTVFVLAAVGGLPDVAQRFVSSTVSHIGIDVPHPDDEDAEDAGDDGGVDRPAGEGGAEDDNRGAGGEDRTHGSEVTSVSQDDTLEGCEKGQTVRSVASSRNQGNPDAPGLREDRDPCAAGSEGGAEDAENGTGDDVDGDGGPPVTPNGGPPEGTPADPPGEGGGGPQGPGSTAPGQTQSNEAGSTASTRGRGRGTGGGGG
ncbi:MAG TPA: hypothetical protein VM618_12840 [Acidimicrobiia bacterium]|nr:hypothetical protein [Acidimicrobiia bacterium]